MQQPTEKKRLEHLQFLLQELQQWARDGLLELEKVEALSLPYQQEIAILEAQLQASEFTSVAEEHEPSTSTETGEPDTSLEEPALEEVTPTSENKDEATEQLQELLNSLSEMGTSSSTEQTESEETTSTASTADSPEIVAGEGFQARADDIAEPAREDQQERSSRRWKQGEGRSRERRGERQEGRSRDWRESRNRNKQSDDSGVGEEAFEATMGMAGAEDVLLATETWEPESEKPREESLWVRVLRPFFAQNWLYFLGTFLVLASGFYLLSLVWSGMNSLTRHSVVWGGLGGGAAAFSAMAAFLYSRFALEEATKTFWFVGLGLLGIANIAAGPILAQSYLIGGGTLALSLAGYFWSSRLLRPFGEPQALSSLGGLLAGQGLLMGLIPVFTQNRQQGAVLAILLLGAGVLWGGTRWLRKQLQPDETQPVDRWQGLVFPGSLFYSFLLLAGWGAWSLRDLLTQPSWRSWFGPVLGVMALALVEVAKAFPLPKTESDEEDQREKLSFWVAFATLVAVAGVVVGYGSAVPRLLSSSLLLGMSFVQALRWGRRPLFVLSVAALCLVSFSAFQTFLPNSVWGAEGFSLTHALNGLFIMPPLLLLSLASRWMEQREEDVYLRGAQVFNIAYFVLFVAGFLLLLGGALDKPGLLRWGGGVYVLGAFWSALSSRARFLGHLSASSLVLWLLLGVSQGSDPFVWHWLFTSVVALLFWGGSRLLRQRAMLTMASLYAGWVVWLVPVSIGLLVYAMKPAIEVGMGNWKPGFLWLLASLLCAGHGVALAHLAQKSKLQKLPYLAMTVIGMGLAIFGQVLPRSMGQKPSDFLGGLFALLAAYGLWWLSQRQEAAFSANTPTESEEYEAISVFQRTEAPVWSLWGRPLFHGSLLVALAAMGIGLWKPELWLGGRVFLVLGVLGYLAWMGSGRGSGIAALGLYGLSWVGGFLFIHMLKAGVGVKTGFAAWNEYDQHWSLARPHWIAFFRSFALFWTLALGGLTWWKGSSSWLEKWKFEGGFYRTLRLLLPLGSFFLLFELGVWMLAAPGGDPFQAVALWEALLIVVMLYATAYILRSSFWMVVGILSLVATSQVVFHHLVPLSMIPMTTALSVLGGYLLVVVLQWQKRRSTEPAVAQDAEESEEFETQVVEEATSELLWWHRVHHRTFGNLSVLLLLSYVGFWSFGILRPGALQLGMVIAALPLLLEGWQRLVAGTKGRGHLSLGIGVVGLSATMFFVDSLPASLVQNSAWLKWGVSLTFLGLLYEILLRASIRLEERAEEKSLRKAFLELVQHSVEGWMGTAQILALGFLCWGGWTTDKAGFVYPLLLTIPLLVGLLRKREKPPAVLVAFLLSYSWLLGARSLWPSVIEWGSAFLWGAAAGWMLLALLCGLLSSRSKLFEVVAKAARLVSTQFVGLILLLWMAYPFLFFFGVAEGSWVRSVSALSLVPILTLLAFLQNRKVDLFQQWLWVAFLFPVILWARGSGVGILGMGWAVAALLWTALFWLATRMAPEISDLEAPRLVPAPEDAEIELEIDKHGEDDDVAETESAEDVVEAGANEGIESSESEETPVVAEESVDSFEDEEELELPEEIQSASYPETLWTSLALSRMALKAAVGLSGVGALLLLVGMNFTQAIVMTSLVTAAWGWMSRQQRQDAFWLPGATLSAAGLGAALFLLTGISVHSSTSRWVQWPFAYAFALLIMMAVLPGFRHVSLRIDSEESAKGKRLAGISASLLLLSSVLLLAVAAFFSSGWTFPGKVVFCVQLALLTWLWMRLAVWQQKDTWANFGVASFFGLYGWLRLKLGLGGASGGPWVLLVVGFIFVGFRVFWERLGGEILQRAMSRASFLLPLVALLMSFQQEVMPTGLWLLCGIFYGTMAWQWKKTILYLPALVFVNVELYRMLAASGASNALWYAQPAAFTLFAFSTLFRESLDRKGRNLLRSLGGLAITLSGTYQIFFFNSIYDVMLLAILCIAGIAIGIALRIRSYLFLGAGFLVLDIVFNLFRIGVQDRVIGMVFLFVLGLLILATAVVFNLKKDVWLERVKVWRESLDSWD